MLLIVNCTSRWETFKFLGFGATYVRDLTVIGQNWNLSGSLVCTKCIVPWTYSGDVICFKLLTSFRYSAGFLYLLLPRSYPSQYKKVHGFVGEQMTFPMLFISMTTYERCSVLNQRQCHWSTAQTTINNKWTLMVPYCSSLRWGYTGAPPHKEAVMRKAFPCANVIMQYTVALCSDMSEVHIVSEVIRKLRVESHRNKTPIWNWKGGGQSTFFIIRQFDIS